MGKVKLGLAVQALREAPSLLETARMAAISQLKATDAECPVCGFTGKFRPFGAPSRPAVQCPSCCSLERHRLLALAVQGGHVSFDGKDVLNFPADAAFGMLASNAGRYLTSNYPEKNGADFGFDIEAIDAPDDSFDVIGCSHVLEHVDDRKALAELYRVLRPGGSLLIMIPVIEGWSMTYEDPSITSERDRHIHFGQFDHVRYYGSDVRQRILKAGFALEEFTSDPADSIKYRLMRGEKVFIAAKRAE